MKYGIKHDSGVIQAISKFPDDVLASGFIDLKKEVYDSFISQLAGNPFATYDVHNNALVLDAGALATATAADAKAKVRSRLKLMSIELDLMTRLGESTTDLQADFDALKVTYDGL